MTTDRHTEQLLLEPESTHRLANLCGHLNEHIQQIEQSLALKIRHRGNRFELSGSPGAVADGARILNDLYQATSGTTLSPDNVHLALRENGPEAQAGDNAGQEPVSHLIHTPRSTIKPRGLHQRQYVNAIRGQDINFGIGPAGTGKTYLAVACAVEALMQDRIKRLLLVRPAVEAGEKLGFLPGDLAQKIDPYLRPLYDSLYEMLGFEKVGRLIEKNVIEVAPLAYMRGRTLNGSFIILDESQNTTVAQMKMFLTRIGFGSRAVITGDVTQIDLPRGTRSGLVHVLKVLDGMQDIGFTHFNSRDVVRHALVQRIVEAYDRYDQDSTVKALGQQERPHRHERDHRAD